MNRVGLYFFVFATVLSIVDIAIPKTSVEIEIAKSVLLIFCGIIVGLFLFSKEQDFVITGIAFVIAGSILPVILGEFFIISAFGKILSNFVLFTASAIVTLSFKQIVDIIAKNSGVEEVPHEGVTIHHLEHRSFEITWSVIILSAVAISILQILSEIFFDLSSYSLILNLLDTVIISLFLVDLVILYEQSKNIKQFFKKNIFDVLAVIPTLFIFRAFKLIRAVKIIRILRSAAKLNRLMKISHTNELINESHSISIETKPADKKIISSKKRSKSRKTKSKKTIKIIKTKKPIKKSKPTSQTKKSKRK